MGGAVTRSPFLIPALFLVLVVGAACSSVVTSDGTDVTSIRSVQGQSHHSPMVGETVTVHGRVTAVRESPELNGFWLQDGGHDAGRASSGVFVRTSGATVVSRGDAVRVMGEVTEIASERFLPSTQIGASHVSASAEPVPVPEPVRIGFGGVGIPEVIDDDRLQLYDPQNDAIDFWESLEGMLVEISGATVVGPTNRHGEFVIVPESEVSDASRTSRGGILLRPDDENSERLTVDPGPRESPFVVRVGDRLNGPVRGVVHYDYGTYRLVATSAPEIEERPEQGRRTPSRDEGFTIASYNVLNLSAANESHRFESIAGSIVGDLGSPDIVGLQEIQDDSGGKDDGIVSAERTLARLSDAIVAAGGPEYSWRQIDPIDNADGGAPGANIRVAYLVNPERVEIVDRGDAGAMDEVSVQGTGRSVRYSLSPGRIGTSTPCFLGEGSSDESEGTRKSLALEVVFGGETYFLINNHLKSKRGDDPVFGAVQPPVRHTEPQRLCQTELIASVAEEILDRDPEANVIVVGDLNEHEFRPPMMPFEEAGLINMIKRVPIQERYTYNYLGNSQVLDHILVSDSLADRSRLLIPHVNSDFPDTVAASDHNPLLLTIHTGSAQ